MKWRFPLISDSPRATGCHGNGTTAPPRQVCPARTRLAVTPRISFSPADRPAFFPVSAESSGVTAEKGPPGGSENRELGVWTCDLTFFLNKLLRERNEKCRYLSGLLGRTEGRGGVCSVCARTAQGEVRKGTVLVPRELQHPRATSTPAPRPTGHGIAFHTLPERL